MDSSTLLSVIPEDLVRQWEREGGLVGLRRRVERSGLFVPVRACLFRMLALIEQCPSQSMSLKILFNQGR